MDIQRLKRSAGALGGSAALLALAAGGALAQDATPGAVEGVVLDLPVGIYAGVCGEGGDLEPIPAYELGVIGPTADQDPDRPGAEEIRGLQLSPPVLRLEATVEAPLDDLLAAPHAVAVRQGTEAERVVACGQIGGAVDDGELAVGLRPLTGERWYGVAVLDAEGGVPVVGEDQTEVTVYLFQEQGQPGPLGAAATPEAAATPAR